MKVVRDKRFIPTRFLARRRERQRVGDVTRGYSFELAATHALTLVTMATIDEHVRSVEVDEVAAFVDRIALPVDDIAHLNALVRSAWHTPIPLEDLADDLIALAACPALATTLVTDLARVAAADERVDQRERVFLAHVCDLLGVAPVEIPVPDERCTGDDAPLQQLGIRARPRPPRLIASSRIRSSVCRALELSYQTAERSI